MKSILSLCLILGTLFSISARAESAPQMENLFARVSDVGSDSFVAHELSEAFCADSKEYSLRQIKMAEQLTTLRAEEVQMVTEYDTMPEDSWGSIHKKVFKRQLARKGTQVLLFAQRKSFVDRATATDCR